MQHLTERVPGTGEPRSMLDARGQKCPLPVLRAEKSLSAMQSGEVVVVLATDPMARIDIVHYCRQNGHAVSLSEDEGVLRFEIICKGAG